MGMKEGEELLKLFLLSQLLLEISEFTVISAPICKRFITLAVHVPPFKVLLVPFVHQCWLSVNILVEVMGC